MRRQIISTLSKGYRQRVGLAAAILHGPRVLVLDEPTVGLDPNQIIAIRELIRDLGRERTLILSTHILPEVEQLCDRVLIIDRGQLIAEGTPKELEERSRGQSHLTVTFKDGGGGVGSGMARPAGPAARGRRGRAARGRPLPARRRGRRRRPRSGLPPGGRLRPGAARAGREEGFARRRFRAPDPGSGRRPRRPGPAGLGGRRRIPSRRCRIRRRPRPGGTVMRSFLAVAERELRAYFVSPLAWIILTFFLFGQGVIFTMIVSYLNDPRQVAGATPSTSSSTASSSGSPCSSSPR